MAMVSTRLAEQRWTEDWAKAAFGTRDGVAAPSIVVGKRLFDAYRHEQAAFDAQLRIRTEGLARREQRLIAARVLLELAVFVVVLLFAMHQHRALREAIVTPIAALLLHIRRIPRRPARYHERTRCAARARGVGSRVE